MKVPADWPMQDVSKWPDLDTHRGNPFDMPMPNGKTLRDCTNQDLKMFIEISKEWVRANTLPGRLEK
jgi:hypothetical protein